MAEPLPTYCVALPDELFDTMEAKHRSVTIVYRLEDLWEEWHIRHYLASGSLHVIFIRQSDFPMPTQGVLGQVEACTLDEFRANVEARRQKQEA